MNPPFRAVHRRLSRTPGLLAITVCVTVAGCSHSTTLDPPTVAPVASSSDAVPVGPVAPVAPVVPPSPSVTRRPTPQAPVTRSLQPLPGTAPVVPPAPAPAPPAPAGGGLAGRTIAIDPGHNGGNAGAPGAINAMVPAGGFSKPCDTTGTSTDAGYPEYAFTMDVAARLAALLRAQGANVVLTRSDSSGVGPCVNVRAAIGNQAHADAAISIHADGGPAGDPGFHVIAPGLAPDAGNAAILGESAALARSVKVAFAAGTGEQTAAYEAPGLVVRTDLGGLNLSRVPKIFIECANMRNPSDAARVTSGQWRQEAAGAIFNGLRTYLGG